MTKKPNISTVASGYQGTVTINNNFQNIRDQFDNTLSRDGSTPNAMLADLDMNGNAILNIGINENDPQSFMTLGTADARYVNTAGDTMTGNFSAPNLYTNGLYINGTPVFPSTVAYNGVIKETQIATSGQTVFNLNNISYTPNINNLAIYVNGLYQNPSKYTENSLTQVTFLVGLNVGAVVDFVVLSIATLSGTADAVNLTYTAPGVTNTRTVYSKLSENISVKDFGAIGDGVTDDTVAIQEAIIALAQNGGKLDFPNATYLVTDTLILPFGNNARDKVFVLEFNGSKIKSNVAAPTGSTYTGFISGYLSGSTAIASVTGTEAHVAANVVIQNVHLTGFGMAIRLHNFNYGCAIQNVYATACFNGIHLSRCFYLVVNNAFLTGRGRTVGGVGFKTEAFSNILPLSGIKTNEYDIGMQLGGFDGGKIESSSAEVCNIGVDLDTQSSVLYVDTIYLEGNATANLRISGNVRRLLLTNSWFYGDSDKHVTCTLDGTSFANMTVISTSFQNGITNSPPISNVFGDVLNYGADPITPPTFSGLPNLRAISPHYEIDTAASGYNGNIRSLDSRYYNGLIPTAYGGRFRNGVSSANRTPFQTAVNNSGSFEFTTEYNEDGFTALLWSVSIAFATGTYRRTFLVFYDNNFEVWRLYEPGASGLTLETSATCTVVNGFLRLKAPTLTGPAVNYSIIRPL